MSDGAVLDLDMCAREPIRIPGGIQPHGALLVLDPDDFTLRHASANLFERTGVDPDGAGPLLPESVAADLRRWLIDDAKTYLRTHDINGHVLQISGHSTPQGVVLEFEDPPEQRGETLEAIYPRLRAFVDAIGQAATLAAIGDLAVREIRALTGFNRVMLYSFDAQGDGTVLSEDGDGVLPSYLDLRFPASDIPAQARELYRLSRLRLIPDANYAASPILPPLSPVDGKPLDLSLAALRSVSPIHLQYMRNMGTAASMSISILVDGALWGLISCHNAEPRRLNAQIRTACDFLGQIISLQIGSRERSENGRLRVELKRIEARLLAKISQNTNYQDGLVANAEDWLSLVDAQGAIVTTPGHVVSVGSTPSTPEVLALAQWLHQKGVTETFETDSLSALWPQADAFSGPASGLLAISISQIHPSYIMWFREEVVRTVKWGGDPRKSEVVTDQLHPRRSFEIWKELVRKQSRAWSDVEIEGARDFRHAIVNFVLRRAEERAELSDQLQRSNAELEAFSYSISHDLRAPFRHIVGYAELLADREKELGEKSSHYLRSIVEAALSAGRLVDDLLNFSQVGRINLAAARVDVNKLVEEVRRSVQPDVGDRPVEWRVGTLPPAYGDASLLRQALTNLIDNAVKYTQGREPAVITITGVEQVPNIVYEISDNGVGFDNAYVGKLFGVFQRLHRAEDFPGTGIGLALTKRIIDRHGGSISAHGTVGVGASFTIVLPNRRKTEQVRGEFESHSSGGGQSEGSRADTGGVEQVQPGQ